VINVDVLVYGDEVESILTAVSAARQGAKVALVRRSTGRLGGLSVRGGLSYMDITPDFICGIFAEFLQRCGVVRIALNPERAASVLQSMLEESEVALHSGYSVGGCFPPTVNPSSAKGNENNFAKTKVDFKHTKNNEHLECRTSVFIDATPDADVARQLGVPYIEGLGGLLGSDRNFLGVSPVFRIQGVSVAEMQAFESDIRANPELPQILKAALPYHPDQLLSDYVTRPTFAPDDMDYLDVLNPVIGIDYHIWRHGNAETYQQALMAIDGGNISRLADGSLGFNGLVVTAKGLDLDFNSLVTLSQDGEIPQALLDEMQHFQRYLREKAGFKHAEVIPPESLYIRQTLTLISHRNMTAKRMLSGGAEPEKAIGTFSYWLDLRGIPFWQAFPGEPELAKPVFNLEAGVAYSDKTGLENFAFVSRSAGYSPIGQGAGRIIQHNSLLGEAIGIAAALSCQSKRSLRDQLEAHLIEVQFILQVVRDGNCPLSGCATLSDAQLTESQLLERDEQIVKAHGGAV
jgi:FAD dependent oxidoreductase